MKFVAIYHWESELGQSLSAPFFVEAEDKSSAFSRVEQVVEKELGMRFPTPSCSGIFTEEEYAKMKGK